MAEQKSRRTTRTRKDSDSAGSNDKPKRRSLTKQATDTATGQQAPDVPDTEDVTGTVGDVGETAGDVGETAGGIADMGGEKTVREELRSIVREAALEVLGPVARKATTSAAKYAITKGPGLAKDTLAPKLKDTLGPKIEEAGGAGELAKGALSTVSGAGGGLLSKVGIGGGGGEEAGGTGKGRRLPVQESVDVAVPLETAYNQFTQFEEFPKFMHRVEKVEQRDDSHLVWHENIWGIRREWEAEITEQRPNERIAWKSLSGTHSKGVVTFHELSDRLTRIEVVLDFQPHGLLEKTASGLRMSRRALKSDLMRFKAFVEMSEEETGAWRGRIEEGEVVEGAEGEEREAEEPEAEEEEEPEAEAEEEEEPEADEEEEEEEEEEESPVARRRPAAADEEEEEGEEPEEEERPKKQPARRVRRRAPARGRRRVSS